MNESTGPFASGPPSYEGGRNWRATARKIIASGSAGNNLRRWSSDLQERNLRSYTRTLDGDQLDAALLLLALYGYTEPAAPRMRATCERIRERLGAGGLIYRYKDTGEYDGLPGEEGAFGICSFWGVECLARSGELDAAADLERILGGGMMPGGSAWGREGAAREAACEFERDRLACRPAATMALR